MVVLSCGASGADSGRQSTRSRVPSWCRAVESALGDAAGERGLECLEVPNFLVTGFYGTRSNPERSDFVNGCFGGETDAPERLRMAVRPVGDLRFHYSSEVRATASGGVNLDFLGPWAPRVSGSLMSGEQLAVDVELADAEIRVLSSVAEILGQRYQAAASAPKALEACLETLCDGSSSADPLVYTAKVIAAVPIIRISARSRRGRAGTASVGAGLAGFEVRNENRSDGVTELRAKEKLNIAAILEPARPAFERAKTCQALRDARARRDVVSGLREIALRALGNRDLGNAPARIAGLRGTLRQNEHAFTAHEERDASVCMEALEAASRDLALAKPGRTICTTRDLLGTVLTGGSEDDRLHELVIDVVQPLHRRLTEIADDQGLPCADPAFYRDEDGDGYGDPSRAKRAPKAPPGYVENSLDCFDRDANVRPGQKSFFAEPRPDGSFDYDCDTRETRENDTVAGGCKQISRFGIPIKCWAEPGFRTKVPACGQQGRWFAECVEGMLSCDEGPDKAMRQRCR